MPDGAVVFQLGDNIREVSGLPLNGKLVVLKEGDKQKVTDPGDLAVWRATKGVREASKAKGGSR